MLYSPHALVRAYRRLIVASRPLLLMALLGTAGASSAFAKTDLETINRIRIEGLYHSQVMTTLQHLTDHIGPRLTGSPEMQQASAWTVEQLKAWGLSNVHLEGFEFGRGWSFDSARAQLLHPRKAPLMGLPVAWTPGSNGVIEGDVVFVDAVTEAELEKYRGKLAGKIVLLSEPEDIGEPAAEIFKRYSSDDLGKMKSLDLKRPASHAHGAPDSIAQNRKRLAFREAVAAFLKQENAKAALYRSSRDGGLVRVFGHDHRVGKTFPVPALVLSSEHYQLLQRLIEKGETPRVALDIDARFHDEDRNSYNTIAEIPGTDKNPEIVMIGAHLDSWHASTGGVDNAAGVAVTMEAMRILKKLDIKPKRTIRIGLWSGEEQGLYGSRAYVEQHLATRPKPADPAERELTPWYWDSPGWPITKKPDYDRFSVYFNMDNGSGKFRGIYTEGNVAVKPLFSEWFGPLSDLSEGTINANATGGTDHESFDNVGLPGFQFVQDPLDYMPRLHHTHVDSFDHVLPDDMRQAAVVMATFAYAAAMSENRVPRKPTPRAPTELEQQQELEKAKKRQRAKEREALSELP
jgi:hypothetical protein